jgi:hypothetical protein
MKHARVLRDMQYCKYVQHVGDTTIRIILNDPLDLEEGLCKRVNIGGVLKGG